MENWNEWGSMSAYIIVIAIMCVGLCTTRAGRDKRTFWLFATIVVLTTLAFFAKYGHKLEFVFVFG